MPQGQTASSLAETLITTMAMAASGEEHELQQEDKPDKDEEEAADADFKDDFEQDSDVDEADVDEDEDVELGSVTVLELDDDSADTEAPNINGTTEALPTTPLDIDVVSEVDEGESGEDFKLDREVTNMVFSLAAAASDDEEHELEEAAPAKAETEEELPRIAELPSAPSEAPSINGTEAFSTTPMDIDLVTEAEEGESGDDFKLETLNMVLGLAAAGADKDDECESAHQGNEQMEGVEPRIADMPSAPSEAPTPPGDVVPALRPATVDPRIPEPSVGVLDIACAEPLAVHPSVAFELVAAEAHHAHEQMGGVEPQIAELPSAPSKVPTPLADVVSAQKPASMDPRIPEPSVGVLDVACAAPMAEHPSAAFELAAAEVDSMPMEQQEVAREDAIDVEVKVVAPASDDALTEEPAKPDLTAMQQEVATSGSAVDIEFADTAASQSGSPPDQRPNQQSDSAELPVASPPDEPVVLAEPDNKVGGGGPVEAKAGPAPALHQADVGESDAAQVMSSQLREQAAVHVEVPDDLGELAPRQGDGPSEPTDQASLVVPAQQVRETTRGPVVPQDAAATVTSKGTSVGAYAVEPPVEDRLTQDTDSSEEQALEPTVFEIRCSLIHEESISEDSQLQMSEVEDLLRTSFGGGRGDETKRRLSTASDGALVKARQSVAFSEADDEGDSFVDDLGFDDRPRVSLATVITDTGAGDEGSEVAGSQHGSFSHKESMRSTSQPGSRPSTQGKLLRAKTDGALHRVYSQPEHKEEQSQERHNSISSAGSSKGTRRRLMQSAHPIRGRRTLGPQAEVVAEETAEKLHSLSRLMAPKDSVAPTRSFKLGHMRPQKEKKGLLNDLERTLHHVQASGETLQELDKATLLVQEAIRKTEEIRRMKRNPREVAEQIRREQAEKATRRQSKETARGTMTRVNSFKSSAADESLGDFGDPFWDESPFHDKGTDHGSSTDEVVMRKRATTKSINITQANSFISKMKALGDGNIGVAWRRHFDSDGDGELSFAEFCSGLARVNHDGDVVELWQHFAGNAGHMSLQALDPTSAMILGKFAKWCADFLGGPIEVFRAIDSDGSDSLTPDEFAEGLRELGFFEPENLAIMPESVHSEELVLKNLYPLMDQNGYGNIQAEQLLFLEKDVAKKAELQKTLNRQRQYGYDGVLQPTTNEALQLLEDLARNASWAAENARDAAGAKPHTRTRRVLAPYSEPLPLNAPVFTKLLSSGSSWTSSLKTSTKEMVIKKGPLKPASPQEFHSSSASSTAGRRRSSDRSLQSVQNEQGGSPVPAPLETTAGVPQKSLISSMSASSLPRLGGGSPLMSTAETTRRDRSLGTGTFFPSSSLGDETSNSSKAALARSKARHAGRTRAIYTCSQVADLPAIGTYTPTSSKAYLDQVARVSSKFKRSQGQWTYTPDTTFQAKPFDPLHTADFFSQAKRQSLYNHYGLRGH